jgi:hypothetical protein
MIALTKRPALKANYRAKKITREAAVAEIARRYRQFADIFEVPIKSNEWRTLL